MRKIIHFAAVLLLCLMPFSALADAGYTDSDFVYEIKPDGTIRIVDYRGKHSRNNPSQQVVIPSEIDGKAVTEIGYEAFASGYSVYEVVVPGCVREIGERAFDSSGIYRVILEEGVEKIGDYAFFNTPLEYIQMPESLTSIGEEAFSGCSWLAEISIPDSVGEIGAEAFEGCTQMQTIRLPKNLAEISFGMFANCTGLKKVKLPNGIVRIGDGAFENCGSLEEISLPNNRELMLGENVFASSGVRKIRMPGKSSRYQLKDDVLYDTESKTVLYALKTGKKKLSVMKGMEKIARSAFMNHPNLEEITLPEGLTCIEEEAFMNCARLQRVGLPGTLTEIRERAFADCVALNEIDFPASLQSIDDAAFSGCTSLQCVVVPGNVKVLGDEVFSFCTNLRKLVFSEGIQRIGSLMLLDCRCISEIVIPRSVEEVDCVTEDYGISVYVYRDSAAHQSISKWNDNYVVIDDTDDIAEQPGIAGLSGRKWAVFSTTTGIRIWIDEQRMYYNDYKDSHTTVSVIREYKVDGNQITSDFFGRANPTVTYRTLSEDMIALLDRAGNSYLALLVRAPGEEGTGLVGKWDAYPYWATYDFKGNGKVTESGNIYRDELDGPFEFDYWMENEIVCVDDGQEPLYYTCHQRSQDLIDAVTNSTKGYFVATKE